VFPQDVQDSIDAKTNHDREVEELETELGLLMQDLQEYARRKCTLLLETE